MTQRVQEQIGALTAIEPKLHFREVGRKMFRADLMPASHNAALQKRESRFHGISVNVGTKPDILFMGVIDRFVLVIADRRLIGWKFIGDDYVHVGTDVLFDVLCQSALAGIFGMEEANVTAALTDSDNNLFAVPLTPPSLSVTAL